MKIRDTIRRKLGQPAPTVLRSLVYDCAVQAMTHPGLLGSSKDYLGHAVSAYLAHP